MAKLQNIKSAIKMAPPKSHVHLKTKPKKNQMLEGNVFLLPFSPLLHLETLLKSVSLTMLERYTEIERENRILLEKMTNIL